MSVSIQWPPLSACLEMILLGVFSQLDIYIYKSTGNYAKSTV